MRILNRIEHLAQSRPPRFCGPATAWTGFPAAGAGALATAAGCFVVAFAVLPPHLALPATAVGLPLAAAALGLTACIAPPETGVPRRVLWDCAGVLSLIGLAAALFGEPEPAIAILERDR